MHPYTRAGIHIPCAQQDMNADVYDSRYQGIPYFSKTLATYIQAPNNVNAREQYRRKRTIYIRTSIYLDICNTYVHPCTMCSARHECRRALLKNKRLATYIQAPNNASACIYMKSIWAEAVDPWAAMNSVAGRSVCRRNRPRYVYVYNHIHTRSRLAPFIS